MLFLLFQLRHDRYALDVAQLVEVLPLVAVTRIPKTPAAVAGVFDYRGVPVPAIDLSQLVLSQPAQRRLSTRMIVVRYPDANGALHLLGLIAEKATETLRREPADFTASGITNAGAPYLGPVVSDEHGLVQWIEVRKLLPATVRDVLYQLPVAALEPPVAGGRKSDHGSH